MIKITYSIGQINLTHKSKIRVDINKRSITNRCKKNEKFPKG